MSREIREKANAASVPDKAGKNGVKRGIELPDCPIPRRSRRSTGKTASPSLPAADRGAPVGVFDSGLGGLTVLSAVRNILPHEDLIYFGDSGRTPYGTKSTETVRRYTLQDVDFLLSKGVKAVVIACNTASACGLAAVKEKYPSLPVIEVVRPGAEAALKATRNGRIGVIGTQATVSSEVYKKAILEASAGRDKKLPEIEYFGKACPMFVPLVEEGWWDNEITRLTVEQYLSELVSQDIDTLVLGCTHYPYLAGTISRVTGGGITLINSAEAVAEAVKERLTSEDLLNGSSEKGTIRFYTSDSEKKFRELAGRFMPGQADAAERIDIEEY